MALGFFGGLDLYLNCVHPVPRIIKINGFISDQKAKYLSLPLLVTTLQIILFVPLSKIDNLQLVGTTISSAICRTVRRYLSEAKAKHNMWGYIVYLYLKVITSYILYEQP